MIWFYAVLRRSYTCVKKNIFPLFEKKKTRSKYSKMKLLLKRNQSFKFHQRAKFITICISTSFRNRKKLKSRKLKVYGCVLKWCPKCFFFGTLVVKVKLKKKNIWFKGKFSPTQYLQFLDSFFSLPSNFCKSIKLLKKYQCFHVISRSCDIFMWNFSKPTKILSRFWSAKLNFQKIWSGEIL